MYAIFLKVNEFQKKITGNEFHLLSYADGFAIAPSVLLIKTLLSSFDNECYDMSDLYVRHNSGNNFQPTTEFFNNQSQKRRD